MNSNAKVEKGEPQHGVGFKLVDKVRPVDFSTQGDVVIRFEDVCKQYRLGVINHGALASDLQSFWARVRGKEDPNVRIDQLHDQGGSNWGQNGTFWALSEVSFEVRSGDVLGIIGRNGAGKSTLLKILSRVTTPTRGEVKIKGRIASLLEVGTGFHPELTGRENIFLNGAIHGMSHREVSQKFDEIVGFSEIEKFIDTPVKRYSSGMYVRLAFSVAAHLDPDIMVIDEVLAVGDTVFQKKCIDKISELNSQGRTILFVSHNLSLVSSLCRSGLVLKDGRVAFSGTARAAIDNYIDEGSLNGQKIDLRSQPRTSGEQQIVFSGVEFLNYPIRFGEAIKFKVDLETRVKGVEFKEVDFGVAISDKERKRIIHCSNRFIGFDIERISDSDEYVFEIQNNLKSGVYYVTLFLRTREVIQDWLTEVFKFEIEDGNPYGYFDTNQINGLILPDFKIYLQHEKNS